MMTIFIQRSRNREHIPALVWIPPIKKTLDSRVATSVSSRCFFFQPILAKFPYFTPKSATTIYTYKQYWLYNE
jgi:hypothetical protein